MKRLALIAIICLCAAQAFAAPNLDGSGIHRSAGSWNEAVTIWCYPGADDSITFRVPGQQAASVSFSLAADTAGLDGSTTTPGSTYIKIHNRNLNVVSADSTSERMAAGTPFNYSGILTSSGTKDSTTLTLNALYFLCADSTNINGQPKAVQMIVHVTDSLLVTIRANFGSH